MELVKTLKVEGDTWNCSINTALCPCNFTGRIETGDGERACPHGHEDLSVAAITDCRPGAAPSEWTLALGTIEFAKVAALRELFSKLADEGVRHGYTSRGAFRKAVEASRRKGNVEVCEVVAENHGAKVAEASAFVEAAIRLVWLAANPNVYHWARPEA